MDMVSSLDVAAADAAGVGTLPSFLWQSNHVFISWSHVSIKKP
jgi:hypothetical protein